MDLRTLTDEELDQHRRDVLAEQERRQRIADTPSRVADLVAAYEADGGDRDALVEAISGKEQA